MFGWLNRRLRREQVKLAKQNALAFEYLRSHEKATIAAGFQPVSRFESVFEMSFHTAEAHLEHLKANDTLVQPLLNDALAMNKDARRAYDQILAGKRSFAMQFGSASEPLVKFDQKFTPNEGWKVFFDHF